MVSPRCTHVKPTLCVMKIPSVLNDIPYTNLVLVYPQVYWTPHSVLMIPLGVLNTLWCTQGIPLCTHGVPPVYSWHLPDVLNTPSVFMISLHSTHGSPSVLHTLVYCTDIQGEADQALIEFWQHILAERSIYDSKALLAKGSRVESQEFKHFHG